ncbi:MAG: ankyrin repeat domain-containing protein [Ruminococcaceae bacterium]|nr:ankyrin repeat domain-containing protein [Oscillospiraceae bacterium]
MKRQYLPVWTDFLSYNDQHNACSIAQTRKYSLLPIQYNNILDSYYIAKNEIIESIYIESANEFFNKYPEMKDFEFGKQACDGVYDIKFKVNYPERKRNFKEILDKNLENSGILLNTKEFNNHFVTISKRVFILSNQYVRYEENEIRYKELFEAAKKRDFNKIQELVYAGAEINAIDRFGETILHKYVSIAFHQSEININELEKLIELGAIPSIYGIEISNSYSLLENAALGHKTDVVEFLLDKGVNPNIFCYLDEPFENLSETLLERTERWAHGDDCTDYKPCDTCRKIADLLIKYM